MVLSHYRGLIKPRRKLGSFLCQRIWPPSNWAQVRTRRAKLFRGSYKCSARFLGFFDQTTACHPPRELLVEPQCKMQARGDVVNGANTRMSWLPGPRKSTVFTQGREVLMSWQLSRNPLGAPHCRSRLQASSPCSSSQEPTDGRAYPADYCRADDAVSRYVRGKPL